MGKVWFTFGLFAWGYNTARLATNGMVKFTANVKNAKNYINDFNNTILKEFDIQTNEFGSFSGEFDIPKNVLTGEFNFEIEEAEHYAVDTKYYNEKEDEHEFWDNVDFNQYEEFSFQVEEYKRPTFEVKFDTIKENYTIGDSIKIKGNAKALAGNNLTNAKVAYSISRSIS